MKVSNEFEPIVITIESMVELIAVRNAIWIGLGNSYSDTADILRPLYDQLEKIHKVNKPA